MVIWNSFFDIQSETFGLREINFIIFALSGLCHIKKKISNSNCKQKKLLRDPLWSPKERKKERKIASNWSQVAIE